MNNELDALEYLVLLLAEGYRNDDPVHTRAVKVQAQYLQSLRTCREDREAALEAEAQQDYDQRDRIIRAWVEKYLRPKR